MFGVIFSERLIKRFISGCGSSEYFGGVIEGVSIEYYYIGEIVRRFRFIGYFSYVSWIGLWSVCLWF